MCYHAGPIVIHLEAGPDAGVDDAVMLHAAANLSIPVADDINDGYHGFGVGYVDRALRFGQKESSSTAYIEPVLSTRPNLVLRSQAQVIQVLTDGKGNALGVVYLDADGEQQTVIIIPPFPPPSTTTSYLSPNYHRYWQTKKSSCRLVCTIAPRF